MQRILIETDKLGLAMMINEAFDPRRVPQGHAQNPLSQDDGRSAIVQFPSCHSVLAKFIEHFQNRTSSAPQLFIRLVSWG